MKLTKEIIDKAIEAGDVLSTYPDGYTVRCNSFTMIIDLMGTDEEDCIRECAVRVETSDHYIVEKGTKECKYAYMKAALEYGRKAKSDVWGAVSKELGL